MRLLGVLSLATMLVVGCVPTETVPPSTSPGAKAPAKAVTIRPTRDAKTAVAAYYRVAGRVRPVAVEICRSFHAAKPRTYCDFQVKVINDPKQRPNAFQSVGKDGRPVISFNINMLREIQNDDEIAFIFGHEAGHRIAQHLEQTERDARAGAILGAIIVASTGGDVDAGIQLGATIGSRSYSKRYELEADAIAAHVADRAGYNASVGSKTFSRLKGSSAILATHPPSAQRADRIGITISKIRRAKAQGTRAPVTW